MQAVPPLPPQNQARALDAIEHLLSWRDGMEEERLELFAGLGREHRAVETPNLPPFPNGHNYLRDNYYHPYPYQDPPLLYRRHHQNDFGRQDPGTVAQEQ